jgi:hypothetical protein
MIPRTSLIVRLILLNIQELSSSQCTRANKHLPSEALERFSHHPSYQATRQMPTCGSTFSISIAQLPGELLYLVSLELSVKDLCFLQAVRSCGHSWSYNPSSLLQTNKRMRVIFLDQAIWRSVIRDILTVKPLPRLTYAYHTMTLEELVDTAKRLAAQDRLLLQNYQRPLTLRNSFGIDTISHGFSFNQVPVLLPGGDYFVLPSASMKRLCVYKTDDASKGNYHLLIPRSSHPIYLWKAIPISADELLVARVTESMQCKDQWYECPSIIDVLSKSISGYPTCRCFAVT